MAETALYLALRKIGLASRQDDSYDETGLVIFQSRLRRIESELRMIHCFLDQLETRYNSNQVQVSWIAEAQKLGCLVEETVDVCIHRLFHPFQKQGINRREACKLFLGIRRQYGSLVARREAFVQLIELEAELEHLSKMKKHWVHMPVDSERAYIPTTRGAAYLPRQLVSDFVNEKPEGFDKERAKLKARLLGHGDGARPVVAVWGPAGSGKTTLVRFVFEELRNHFDCCAWISSSGCSRVEDILTKMRRELCLEGDNGTADNPMEALRRAGKKFLIVFDDMKMTDGISEAGIPQMESRVIIITRIEKVATEVDRDKISLAVLKDSKAFQLFRRVVLRQRLEITDEELMEAYKNVMRIFPRCEGLPQVIISLGTLLSLKQKTQSTWKQMQDQLVWVSQHNSSLDDTRKCLYVAYVNLPMHLKICLLYCGLFPAGHVLLCQKIVRLLVAEGFIEKQKASAVEEEIAEGYLMELICWGFLQLVNSDELGRVAGLQMPIIVHDLVQSIVRKEGFGIATEDDELPQADINVRCLFLSKLPKDIGPLIGLPHLRTLIASYSEAADSHSENLVFSDRLSAASSGSIHQKRFSYLTVLELQGSPLEILPDDIAQLFNLRYLGLRKTKVEYLPRSMRRLYNMQTLDLESSRIKELPDWIGKLATLRHLLASWLTTENRGKTMTGVRAAKDMKKLKELQTLQTVEASADFVKSVDMLTQLRSLSISNVDSKSWKSLLVTLPNLCFLSILAVSAKDGNDALELDDEPNFQQLKSLEISHCKLGEEDSLRSLSRKFGNLVSLRLHNVSGIKMLDFRLDHFPKLRTLNLREMVDVETLVIPYGALASLQVLRVESLAKLNVDRVANIEKIMSVKDCFFPQLRDHLATTDVAKSSSYVSLSLALTTRTTVD